MSFPSVINIQPAPGVAGQRASTNPSATVDAGPGGFIAGTGGVTIARFTWLAADGVTLQNTIIAGVPSVPVGYIADVQQGLITAFLAESTMLAPQGYGLSCYQRGDFWARNTYNAATFGMKVFANMFSGAVFCAATGSFIVNPIGTATAITASIATNVLTVTVTNGYIAPGQFLVGTGVPAGTYVVSQASGTAGSTGTYNLSTTPGTVASEAMTLSSEDGAGGFTGTASFATNVMTVTAATAGSLKVGQIISSASVAVGTYIVSFGTGTGGTGTYNLSTSPGVIGAQAITATAWIETPWYANSAANIGELVKIGVRN